MDMHKPYCLAVRAMIQDAQGRFLLVRRSKSNKAFVGLWELPGGKADEGESPGQTVQREVCEETGLEIALAGVLGAYGIEMSDKRLAILCLYAQVAGGTLTLSHEHDQHVWITLENLGDYELVGGLKEVILHNTQQPARARS